MRRHIFMSQAVSPAGEKSRSRKRLFVGSGKLGSVYVALFVFALLLFGVDQANHRLAEDARGLVTDLSLPILETSSTAISTVRSMLRTTRDYADLASEYETIRAENRHLKALRSQAHIVKARARAYEDLLKYVPEEGSESIAARTIADVQSPFAHSVIVNAGEGRGVVNGLAVLGETGLIGRIISTGKKTARVLLVTDVNSRIPVFVGERRHRALLAGRNGPVLSLMHLPADALLAPGDGVVTSGEGRLLPAGLTVGTVRIVRDGQPEVFLKYRPRETDVVRVLKYNTLVDIATDETPLPVALTGETLVGEVASGGVLDGQALEEVVHAAAVKTETEQPAGSE